MFTDVTAGTVLQKLLRRYWFQISFFALVGVGLYNGRISIRLERIDTTRIVDQTAVVAHQEEVPVRYQEKSSGTTTFSFDFINDEPPVQVKRIEWGSVRKEKVHAFVDRFKRLAQVESRKYGIPVSIILGNALIGSEVGTAAATKQHANYFALPCEQHVEEQYIRGFCYAAYGNAWESFRGHSLLLARPPFRKLDRIELSDYRQWALGLEQLGYPAQGFSAEELIAVIEHYRLDRYEF